MPTHARMARAACLCAACGMQDLKQTWPAACTVRRCRPCACVHVRARALLCAPLHASKRASKLVRPDTHNTHTHRFLTGALEETSKDTGLSTAFLSVVVLPIAGNACEHITAVVVASKNKMDLSLGIAVGSSLQARVAYGRSCVGVGYGRVWAGALTGAPHGRALCFARSPSAACYRLAHTCTQTSACVCTPCLPGPSPSAHKCVHV